MGDLEVAVTCHRCHKDYASEYFLGPDDLCVYCEDFIQTLKRDAEEDREYREREEDETETND